MRNSPYFQFFLKKFTKKKNKGPNLYNESDTLIKYEIMDGAPVRGESIPIRLFLNACESSLTPSYRNIHNKFSVKYYLNLVLVDEEDRRYFKQQEIILWRKDKNASASPTGSNPTFTSAEENKMPEGMNNNSKPTPTTKEENDDN